jgi:integrase
VLSIVARYHREPPSRDQTPVPRRPPIHDESQHVEGGHAAHLRELHLANHHLLLGYGVHPKLVQHFLGHASITITPERYSHWKPSMGRHTADGMDEALG